MDNLRTGRPDTTPARPSHVRGVPAGNHPRRQQEGLRPFGRSLRAGGRRSTGVNAEHREPVDPEMPILTPP